MAGEPHGQRLATRGPRCAEAATGNEPADAVVLGDLGSDFTAATLNAAFRRLMEGAELIVLQHNRYWRRADDLALDVGAYAAALEYASGAEPLVVGKPSREFSGSALDQLDAEPSAAVMVGVPSPATAKTAGTTVMPYLRPRSGRSRTSSFDERVGLAGEAPLPLAALRAERMGELDESASVPVEDAEV